MSGDARQLLDALRVRAQAALAAGESSAAIAVLHEALALQIDPATPPPGSHGRAFGELAALLIELPEPGALEDLFNRALQVFQAAPDTTLGDLVTTWNNLAALYHRHGATEHRDRANTLICDVARRYEGPLDSGCANIFLRLGEVFRQAGSFDAMAVLDRQVQRFMLADPQIPDGTRALWLQRYVLGLEQSQQGAQIEPELGQALADLAARAVPQPLSVGACCMLLAVRHEARGDWTGSARLIERMVAQPGLPDRELTGALSRAGRAWFKAGEFDAASGCCLRAVRRRAGLEGPAGQASPAPP
jgi:tetratricopeptide (TPR) repeat protein